MPTAKAPPIGREVDLDAPSTPLKLAGQVISDDYARRLVDRTLSRCEIYRNQNCDQRWRLNEYLYYGYVPPRVWEGSSIPRSSIPIQICFDQVEAANAKLCRELLENDEIISVTPEGTTHPLAAQQIRDRLLYIMDHNLDDYGWTMRMELQLTIKDLLIYGVNFVLTEWDEDRKQATAMRVDPRDVYVDPGASSPYLEHARAVVLRRSVTVNDMASMRDFPDFRIPSSDVLYGLAENRSVRMADQTKAAQEAARGYRYQPVSDDFLPQPSSRFIDLFIYMGEGREIWQLGKGDGNSVIIYNQPYPYGFKRLVSAPCFTVPNRFYAQSFVDVLDPLQQLMTAMVNLHVDETALALNPPRATKRGVIRTQSSLRWHPGLTNEYDNPKEDLIVHSPQGVTTNIWQDLAYFQSQAESRTGQSGLAVSGQVAPSNANRTKGGVQAQLQAPMERLSQIAKNIERFLLVPMLYRLLAIEHAHAKGTVFAKPPSSSEASALLMTRQLAQRSEGGL